MKGDALEIIIVGQTLSQESYNTIPLSSLGFNLILATIGPSSAQLVRSNDSGSLYMRIRKTYNPK